MDLFGNNHDQLLAMAEKLEGNRCDLFGTKRSEPLFRDFPTTDKAIEATRALNDTLSVLYPAFAPYPAIRRCAAYKLDSLSHKPLHVVLFHDVKYVLRKLAAIRDQGAWFIYLNGKLIAVLEQGESLPIDGGHFDSVANHGRFEWSYSKAQTKSEVSRDLAQRFNEELRRVEEALEL